MGRMVLTDGAAFLGQNLGKSGGFWLLTAVASYDKCLAQKHPVVHCMQFWTLTKHPDGSADLVCRKDKGCKPVVTQHFDMVDCDLNEVQLWVAPQEQYMVIMLPSEY